MPEEGAPVAPSDEILTADEIIRLIRIASELGMSKIRLTGGEPLLRNDIKLLVCGVAPLVESFSRAGLTRVNISLDTLQPDRFTRIARRGSLSQVLAAIDSSVEWGLSPVKINCVVMRGYNEDEVIDFARLTLDKPVDVRFIELMPINWSTGDDAPVPAMASIVPVNRSSESRLITLYANNHLSTFRNSFQGIQPGSQHGQLDAVQLRSAFVSSAEIHSAVESQFGDLVPAETVTNGPARNYRIPGAVGTIGFISQITNDMCARCNRLRLTADGQLRPCLMADGEVDLRLLLRSDANDNEIAEMFRITVLHKPEQHRLEDGMAPIGRNMSQLGG